MSIQNRINRLMFIAAGLGVAATMACTNSNLNCVTAACLPVKPELPDNKLTAQGQVCTADPGSVGYPYKILFIVDVSGSTAQTDPTNNRGPAVQSVIQQYANNPEVSFAIISFDSQPNNLEPIFTRDMNILLPIIPQLNQNRQQTNYLDTLDLAKTIIQNDAELQNATTRARTRYDIQWLSDGVPQPCSSVAEVESHEQTILALTNSEGLFDVRLSTLFLTVNNGAGSNTCPDNESAIMGGMATVGRGTFQALSGANLKFDIQFSDIKQPFNKQMFYVVNESRVVKNGELLADSDTDGVSDDDEKVLGTDPTVMDTHTSGCNDRVSQLEAVNPQLCPSTCARAMQNGNPNTLLDTDTDGLYDCVEASLGIQRAKADSDGDNLIDPLEIRFGTNPGDNATLTADTDGDGVLDSDEIFTGTDPLSAEVNRDLAYIYTPLTATLATTVGTSCFNFNVSNIQLVQTIATATSQAGDNRICLYVEQLPENTSSASSEPTVSRSCFTANYKLTDGHAIKFPVGGGVQFKPSDFAPIICGSAACASITTPTAAVPGP